jgi:tRNA(His) guanylyltransferase
MNDSLGDRMKGNYEDRTRMHLPRRTNTIIRVDGKAFHTFTRDCKRPFDSELMDAMNRTAIALCEGIQGAKIGYVQSDEISIWITDYDELTTDAWFDGNIQKVVSVAASIATAAFNKVWMLRNHALWHANKPGAVYPTDYVPAMFDARAFTIPEVAEVANYFLWRTRDASRNSVQMVARSTFSHKKLENKSTNDLKKMIKEGGIMSWEAMNNSVKYGRLVHRVPTLVDVIGSPLPATRHKWVADGVVGDNFHVWNDIVQNVINKLTPEKPAEEVDTMREYQQKVDKPADDDPDLPRATRYRCL